jgi:Phosphotransferase enzyme family
VTTSSIAEPDLQSICRSALGREVAAAERIGTGRNSRVFRVDLDGGDPRRVVVKVYRRDPGDERDRLGTEFGSLRFLWQNDVRSIPCPIALDRDRHCAIYEYIVGVAATSGTIGTEDVDTAVSFLNALKQLRGVAGSDALPAASEACFSLRDLVTHVAGRLERLRRAHGVDDDVVALHEWIDETLNPLLIGVGEWCRSEARQSAIAFDEPLSRQARTLSPSDFGFHNAIRRPDGKLAFVDFEYFGWDDPAKIIVDYLLHPGMALGDVLKRRFADGVQAAFADVPQLAARARVVYPLYGLKWALILLNDFLPERFSQTRGEWRRAQLAKAQNLVGHVKRNYPHNPYIS